MKKLIGAILAGLLAVLVAQKVLRYLDRVAEETPPRVVSDAGGVPNDPATPLD